MTFDPKELTAELKAITDELAADLRNEYVIRVAAPEVRLDVSPLTEMLAGLVEGQRALTAELKAMKDAKSDPIVVAPRVQDVRIVESKLPPKKRSVKRDFAGRITEISEE